MLHNLLNITQLMSQAEFRRTRDQSDLVFPFYSHSFHFFSIALYIRGNVLLEMSDKGMSFEQSFSTCGLGPLWEPNDPFTEVT